MLELGIWRAYAGLLALAVAVGRRGLHNSARLAAAAHLRVGCGTVGGLRPLLLGGPVAHLASAWVLIGTGLSLLANTR